MITSEDKQSIPDQFDAVTNTVRYIVDIIEEGWHVVLTHGSGPQVGNVLSRSEIAADEVITVPIDYADADVQGALGYMFERAFNNEFNQRGMDNKAVALITQVLVDENSPAFEKPTKPIGPYYDKQEAEKKVQDFGWTVREEPGDGWRRVVPSPEPLEILVLQQISTLIDAGYTVIACGGGGIPVSKDGDGTIHGVEAVIDKDLASSLLATELKADALLISTGVEKVAVNFGNPDQRWLDSMTLSQAREFEAQGHFDAGSMGPKVDAMTRFIANGGGQGLITSPDHISDAIKQRTGTHFIDD